MKRQNFWLPVILATCLLSGSLVGPGALLYGAPSPEVAQEMARVNVNKASLEELETVRGIGPLLAERIVEDRETNGRYARLEDLTRVRGIGQAKLEKIKSQITL